MEHDQEMYAQHGPHDNPYQSPSSVYSSSDILSFQPSSFLLSHHPRQRFPPSDIAFRAHNHHNHHNHHEAEHVYSSPQLTLDPSTLDLRPSPSDLISISSSSSSAATNTTADSSNTTPTGSLRISTYNSNSNNNNNNTQQQQQHHHHHRHHHNHTLPPDSPPTIASVATTPAGVLTRRKARAALEQLQIPTQPAIDTQSSVGSQQQNDLASFHPTGHTDFQSRLHHRAGDMNDVQMPHADLHMHVDDHDNSHQSLIDPIHPHQPSTLTPHAHVYPILPSDTSTASSRYYLSPDTFPNSPATVSSPADISPPSDLQPISPTSTLASSPTSTIPLARSFRSGSLSLGLTTNRSLSLITSAPTTGSIGQPISPSHVHGSQLSSHPHMHPAPYYINHGPVSPIYHPSTPPTSHHTQASSSSSRSSGQTHYSLRGSPAPHAFGRGHGRSSSYGTGSTMSVRSTSPASSVTSALTSLSGGGGGGGSTPSTSGPLGSPISYSETIGDMQMPFNSVPDPLASSHPPTSHFPRAQSHPPTIIPNYPLHHPHQQHHRKSHLAREPYTLPRSNSYIDGSGDGGLPSQPRDSLGWPPSMVPGDVYIHPGTRLTDEEFQAQFPPKPLMTRAPHRKQKLANSDRKAICMYAKQHPSARQEDIAARYNVERSTISKILKNKERWLGCPDDDAKVARKRKPRFDDLELVLKLWVEDARPQKIVLSDALIRSKAKEEARRLGIHEDKFKASSGWLENFKHRVGIRKGKYIGRDHWQEGSESDFDDPNSLRSQAQKANQWSKLHHTSNGGSKDSWDLSLMGSTSPLKETSSIQQFSITESSGKHYQSGFSSEELNTAHSSPQMLHARPGSRHDSSNHHIEEPEMRKTRSRTLAENKEAASSSSVNTSGASISSAAATATAVRNSLNPSASSATIESGVPNTCNTGPSSTTSGPPVSVVQMSDPAFLSRVGPHDTSSSHSVVPEEESSESRKSNSPMGKQF